MKKWIDATVLKFLLVGVVNTLFGTAVMFGCYNLLHLSYWISSAANYVFGSLLSYFLNKHFTFKNKETGWRPIVKFTVNILVCYGLAYGAAKPLTAYLFSFASKSVQENAAMLAGMCFFVVLNYFGQRFFAFAKPGEKAEEEGTKQP